MRIALFTETFLPLIDGIVTRLRATIDELHALGHRTAIIAPEGSVASYDGAPVLPMRGFTNPLYRERTLCPPGPSMGRFLRAFRPDVIHVVNPVLLGIGGIYYGRRYRLPTVASFHTNLAAYAHLYNVPILDPISWFVLRRVHNLAQINLATSGVMVQNLRNHGFRRVELWPRGVDTRMFHPGRYSGDMRLRLSGGRPDKPLLLYVGRLAAEKQLDALTAVFSAGYDATLAIVGEGPDRDRLSRLLAGTPTVFHGPLTGDELASAYASADAFLFPSTTETLGLVLLEAMASGLPVVAARSAPTLELVDGDRETAALLFDPRDPRTIAASVSALLASLPEHKRRARENRARVVAFDWQAPTERLLSIYERAIRLRHRAARIRELLD